MLDVAIVGGGPTGVVAANLCGIAGLSAIVFDREPDVYDLPRAVGMWDDVQRILDDAGILPELLPATCVHDGGEFVDAGLRRIVGFDLPPGFHTANGHPPIRGFHQPTLERVARASLARHPSVALRTNSEVLEITQDADGVTAVVRNVTSGRTDSLRARWLLGCDGASSFVRKACGLAWTSLGYDREWLVVDARLRRDVGLSRHAVQLCDPERPTTLVPLPMDMHRWEFQLRPGERREDMEAPDAVWALLRQWLSPADAEILRAVVYRFHATIAETFRHGRVLLAGDAAHQTPPFLGQGLCSGVRDVHNLVWKLAHVRRGLARDELLDTYTAERRPLAVAMVEYSVQTGRLIDAYAEMARGGPEPPAELRRYGYGGDARLPELSTGLLVPNASGWPGRPVPLVTVETNDACGLFDAVVGSRWAVVSGRDPRPLLDAPTRRYWEALGAAFVSVPEPAGEMLRLLAAHEVVVVRPDRLIYAAGPACSSLRVPGVGGAVAAVTG
jgi:3-(3-hydroxy-phenyl)propionate hydroxylase